MLSKKMLIYIGIGLIVAFIVFIFLASYAARQINPEGKAHDKVEQNEIKK